MQKEILSSSYKWHDFLTPKYRTDVDNVMYIFFFLETTSLYMGVRGSLVNNVLCSKRIYVSVSSQLSNIGQVVSHFLKEGPLQVQAVLKTMHQTRLGMTRDR